MKQRLLVTFVSLALCLGGCSSRAVGAHHDRDGGGEGDANLNNNNSTSPCENGTCEGCCDPAGNCLPGTADDQCGTGGQECMDCATLGGTCENDVCVDTDPCGPNNCPGCCTAGGNCLSGTTSGACGTGGVLCVDCGGLDCVHGHCCEDRDGDGYGVDCPLGDDCDDNAPGIVGACQPNGCPQGFANVPSGTFIAGCLSAVPGACGPDHVPLHDRFLEAFCVEVTEVSVAAFRHTASARPCPRRPSITRATGPWTVFPTVRTTLSTAFRGSRREPIARTGWVGTYPRNGNGKRRRGERTGGCIRGVTQPLMTAIGATSAGAWARTRSSTPGR